MSHVDLGYSQDCASWQVESYHFPSKIGGKPAWLSLENLPTPGNLQCENCQKPLTFLCQLYAPFEEDASNFHRTIFVFICRDPKCCVGNTNCNVKVFRNSLPRRNKFYSFDPPDEGKRDCGFSLRKWVTLCDFCGCLGEKKCAKCKKKTYCSREHQVIDWKEGHKIECEKEETPRSSLSLFSESEIVIEAEDIDEKNVNESEEVEKFNQLQLEGKTGTMTDVCDSDLEKYVCNTDKVFNRFKTRISHNPDQILRYERGGEPLWIAENPKPGEIPDCENCGNPRQFEFQIMPQLWAILHENDLDIGIIIVYTCVKSCIGGENYKREFVFKQDVAIDG